MFRWLAFSAALAFVACSPFGADSPAVDAGVADADADAAPTSDAGARFCSGSKAKLCNDFEDSDLLHGFTKETSDVPILAIAKEAAGNVVRARYPNDNKRHVLRTTTGANLQRLGLGFSVRVDSTKDYVEIATLDCDAPAGLRIVVALDNGKLRVIEAPPAGTDGGNTDLLVVGSTATDRLERYELEVTFNPMGAAVTLTRGGQRTDAAEHLLKAAVPIPGAFELQLGVFFVRGVPSGTPLGGTFTLDDVVLDWM